MDPLLLNPYYSTLWLKREPKDENSNDVLSYTSFYLTKVPEIAPKILMNEDGKNITMTNNTALFAKWYNTYKDKFPFKETPVIQNFAATNIIPCYIGPEYIIHGAKLYSQWDPTKTSITLVISE